MKDLDIHKVALCYTADYEERSAIDGRDAIDGLRFTALIDTNKTDEVLQHFGFTGKDVKFCSLMVSYNPEKDELENSRLVVRFNENALSYPQSVQLTDNDKEHIRTLLDKQMRTLCGWYEGCKGLKEICERYAQIKEAKEAEAKETVNEMDDMEETR